MSKNLGLSGIAPAVCLAAVLVAVVGDGAAQAASFVGLSSVRAQWFENQTIPFFPVDPGDRFGAALAAGDFNGDGAMDLATAIPGDWGSTLDPYAGIGAVVVRWGQSGTGLAGGIADTWLSLYAPGSQLPPFEDGAEFGAALAVGDFNGDGLDDLAVGIPNYRFGYPGTPFPNDHLTWGAVSIHYGLPNGIQTAGEHVLHMGANGVPWNPGQGAVDLLGTALAAGDFNGDGYDDLAMGAPHNYNEGAVVVVHGHFGGVYPFDGYLIMQGLAGTPDVGEEGDHFGRALAAGNFNGDVRCTDACRPIDDLAIGVPGEDGEGAVMTIFGSEFSLIFGLSNYLGQFDLGGSFGEAGDEFGRNLASGDFDGDGNDELVVGTPSEDLGSGNSRPDAGEVTVIRGLSAVSPYFTSATRLTQGAIFGDPNYDQTNDRFGAALATADFDRDGFEDLAIGIPGEDAGGADRGGFAVLDGGAGGLYSAFRFLTAGSQGIPPAAQNSADMGAALAAGDFDGDGHPDLAIGLPYRTAGGFEDAGAETVLYGSLFSSGFESGSTSDWSAAVP